MLSRAEELCHTAEDIVNDSQDGSSTEDLSGSEEEDMDTEEETLLDVLQHIANAIMSFEGRAGLDLPILLESAALAIKKLSSRKSAGPQSKR